MRFRLCWYPLAIEYSSTLSSIAVGVAVHLRRVIGAEFALRLAMWAAFRLVRWRVPGGRWHRGMERGARSMCLLVPGVPPS